MEFGFEDLVGQVERAGGDPPEQLKRAAALSKEVSAMADDLLDHFVQRGREAGLTWTQIGEILNVSKQAAQQRSARFLSGLSHRSAIEFIRDIAPMKGMFHRFTDKARTAVAASTQVARDMHHSHVGTEHLLLGLLHVDGVGREALERSGLTASFATRWVERVIGRGGAEAGAKRVRFTPRAKKAIEGSLREALKLGHNYIGTEHLALALAHADPDSAGRKLLAEAGVDPEALQTAIVEILKAWPPRGAAGSGADQA